MNTLSNQYNLDVDGPEQVADVLERAAGVYRESEGDLSSAWQDPAAGRVWRDIAKILERAASACRKAVDRRIG
jgi:hypothetical protein